MDKRARYPAYRSATFDARARRRKCATRGRCGLPRWHRRISGTFVMTRSDAPSPGVGTSPGVKRHWPYAITDDGAIRDWGLPAPLCFSATKPPPANRYAHPTLRNGSAGRASQLRWRRAKLAALVLRMMKGSVLTGTVRDEKAVQRGWSTLGEYLSSPQNGARVLTRVLAPTASYHGQPRDYRVYGLPPEYTFAREQLG